MTHKQLLKETRRILDQLIDKPDLIIGIEVWNKGVNVCTLSEFRISTRIAYWNNTKFIGSVDNNIRDEIDISKLKTDVNTFLNKYFKELNLCVK